MGARDPRLNPDGKLRFALGCHFQAYQREVPPPDHVKPIPFQVVLHLTTSSTAYAVMAAAEGTMAIADMILLAVFFLLRPGEYTSSNHKMIGPLLVNGWLSTKWAHIHGCFAL